MNQLFSNELIHRMATDGKKYESPINLAAVLKTRDEIVLKVKANERFCPPFFPPAPPSCGDAAILLNQKLKMIETLFQEWRKEIDRIFYTHAADVSGDETGQIYFALAQVLYAMLSHTNLHWNVDRYSDFPSTLVTQVTPRETLHLRYTGMQGLTHSAVCHALLIEYGRSPSRMDYTFAWTQLGEATDYVHARTVHHRVVVVPLITGVTPGRYYFLKDDPYKEAITALIPRGLMSPPPVHYNVYKNFIQSAGSLV